MPSRSAPIDPWLLVGRVVAPFGIAGAVKIQVFTAYPERFTERPLYIGTSRSRYDVEEWRPHAQSAVLLLSGVNTREAAEALRDEELYVRIEDAAPLPEGEYYIHELVGLSVVTDDGQPVGSVVDVIQTGSNDVYVVETDRKREVLIPAIKEVIAEINVPGRTLTIHPMEGLELE